MAKTVPVALGAERAHPFTEIRWQSLPIPELELARVRRALDQFCVRVSPASRSQLAYVYTIERNAGELIERRPHFRDRARHNEHQFAKCVYNAKTGSWSLRWRDRNMRWHLYEGFESVPHFRDVLREVEGDPIHIFFG